jgi:hypothetical protein
MSITFSVLARIVQERKFIKLGAIVITCAAADDITVPFTVVIAIVKAGDFISSLYVISLCNLCVGNDFYS